MCISPALVLTALFGQVAPPAPPLPPLGADPAGRP